MIALLRMHLFEYGTIPSWNFAMCGGQPELAVPFSWAYAWPSLLAYALPPVAAILALWGGLTLLGFVSVRALLLGWTGSRSGAFLGACVYAFSGYFAGRFNVGHANFAFFHLVPAMMLLFEVAFARRLGGESAAGATAASTALAFLFFSSAGPHALAHFYPAFLLLIAFRGLAAARAGGALRALRAAAPLLAAQGLGAWLAAYKLWPVIRWQIASPREPAFEAYGLGEILLGTVRWIPAGGFLALDPWQGLEIGIYHPAEFHAFVGPLPWLLGALGVAGRLRARRSGPEPGVAAFDVAIYGFVLVAFALSASLGNGRFASPSQVLGFLPLLSGIRAFPRYQILTVFGLASLTAVGFARLESRWRGRRGGRALLVAVAVATAGPVWLQGGLLVWNLPAVAKAELLAAYGDPPRPDPPQLVTLRNPFTHQTALVERGYWITNCYTNLTLPGRGPTATSRRRLRPLTQPPPIALEALAHDRLELVYPAEGPPWISLRLRVADGFEFDAPVQRQGTVALVRREDLVGNRLRIRAVYPGPREGLAASLAAAVAAALWVAVYRRFGAGASASRSRASSVQRA